MIKHAGTERARKEMCKQKQCEKLKIMENVKNQQPEIYERQMRYMREKTTKVKWIGGAKERHGAKYYDSAEIKNQSYVRITMMFQIRISCNNYIPLR